MLLYMGRRSYVLNKKFALYKNHDGRIMSESIWCCQTVYICIFERANISKCSKWKSVFMNLSLQQQYFLWYSLRCSFCHWSPISRLYSGSPTNPTQSELPHYYADGISLWNSSTFLTIHSMIQCGKLKSESFTSCSPHDVRPVQQLRKFLTFDRKGNANEIVS